MAAEFSHGIDRTIHRDGQLFCFGWGFIPGDRITSLAVDVCSDETVLTTLSAEIGVVREDVAAIFSSEAALRSGFVCMGSFPEQRITSVVFRWGFEHGSVESVAVAVVPAGPGTHKVAVLAKRVGEKVKVVRQVVRSVGLRGAARRFAKNRWLRESGGKVRRRLRSGRRSGRRIALIFDHDLGGGANIYRNDTISALTNDNYDVVLVSFHLGSLRYFVEIGRGPSRVRAAFDNLSDLWNIVPADRVELMIYNCAVGFARPLDVVEIILDLHRRSRMRLLVLIHDYFPLCPSHTLLNDVGTHCEIPDLAVCNGCLARHDAGFVSLANVRDINVWRETWGRLLAVADEVRCFSASSRDLISKAYPAVRPPVLTLVPHELHTAMRPVVPDVGGGLHIGLLGGIVPAKGSVVVRALIEHIAELGGAVPVTVIGTFDSDVKYDFVSITGRYAAAELPDVVSRSGANVFLFPSIWPETFSYVAHELAGMELPFACFDLGAQAELARGYDRGVVLNTSDPAHVLASLEELWKRTYDPERSQPA